MEQLIFTTIIESWVIDEKTGDEVFKKITKRFYSKEERDEFREKYRRGLIGGIAESNLAIIEESYLESLTCNEWN
jgi:hypothetical protein